MGTRQSLGRPHSGGVARVDRLDQPFDGRRKISRLSERRSCEGKAHQKRLPEKELKPVKLKLHLRHTLLALSIYQTPWEAVAKSNTNALQDLADIGLAYRSDVPPHGWLVTYLSKNMATSGSGSLALRNTRLARWPSARVQRAFLPRLRAEHGRWRCPPMTLH